MIEAKKLFLMRHGIAVDHGTPGYEDSERPLTREGISEMKEIAQGISVLGLHFDLILASPFVRTRETAEIVAKALNLEKKLQFSPALESGADPRTILKELQKHSEERILLVGHEPYLSELLSLMISGRKDAAIQFKKGGLCKLNVQSLHPTDPSAVLKWLMTPKQLILLGRA